MPIDKYGMEWLAFGDDWESVIEKHNIALMYCCDRGSSRHSHKNHYELGYVTNGNAVHILGDKRTIIKKGDYFFIDIDIEHEYKGSDDFELINLLFYPEIIDPFLKDCRHFSEIVRHYLTGFSDSGLTVAMQNICTDTDGKIFGIIMELEEEVWQGYRPGYTLVVKCLMLRLIVEIMRVMDNSSTDLTSDKISRRVINEIEKSYGESIAFSAIAKKVSYSVPYLSKRFKAETGYSFTEYLQLYRLQKACALLKTTDKTIRTVAGEVGYRDLRFFYGIFRRAFGVTPLTYRKMNSPAAVKLHKQILPDITF